MKMETVVKGSDPFEERTCSAPQPPPLPGPATTYSKRPVVGGSSSSFRGYRCVPAATTDLWERLFDEGYKADVCVHTENGGTIYGHANVLGMASPVLRQMLKQARKHGHQRSISIVGVPSEAVRVFIRFLYSSCYAKEEMDEFGLHLLVLSHVYAIPQLKRECERQIEHGLITTENVVDIFQLALLCDAPRLSFICHRRISNNFKSVSATDGWTAMKQSHPVLEKILLEFIADEDNRRKKRVRNRNESQVYLQLCEAMEALVHICKDGCRTIGPHDKDFKVNQNPCNFAACKGLESLVRHFSSCKLRVPGGCIHCKRMWQLLELHSRLCADSDVCRVPLCRTFKERSRKQSKKEEIKWTILVEKLLRTKCFSGRPFFSRAITVNS
ncbi:BTB/POZ and TAZ domain-containing protein 4 [Humulus lupulus]|uniref:BTB/POZ and TAZ domain-containing protein 4 n=1 Tax=Humulus lupulus TaxID=3486 RepID=UPI002B40FAF6|nr:BTB/POZ and TAZ domain-containing protein 4 [Humulus lupulus]XP_062101823.1 BTB/POZ and TAZ domain-containing protein 4 [Humulus lupulus]